MSFGSQKLVHTDGTMHHLGIDAVTPRVILVPDPQEVPLYAALLEGPVQQGCYREYATWRGIWRGEPLTVMSCGFGCMPMAIAVEELHHLGALLSCGVPDAGLFRSHDCTSLESPWAPGGPARIAHWAELGVSALDGETSALFVLASILGMHAASLAYLAENYATGAAAPMDAQARGRLFTAAAEALRCC